MKKVSRRAYGRIGRTRNVPDFSKESHAQSIVQVSEADFSRILEDIVDKKGLFNAVQDELDEIALIGTLRLKQKELKEIAVRIRNILGMLDASGFTPEEREEEDTFGKIVPNLPEIESGEDVAEALAKAVEEKGLYDAIMGEQDEIVKIGNELTYIDASEITERCGNILGFLEVSGFTSNGTEDENEG